MLHESCTSNYYCHALSKHVKYAVGPSQYESLLCFTQHLKMHVCFASDFECLF